MASIRPKINLINFIFETSILPIHSDDWHNPYTNASVDWQPHLRPDELSDPDMDSLAAFGPAAVHAARTKASNWKAPVQSPIYED